MEYSKPTFKKSLKDKIQIGEYIENIQYKIIDIDGSLLLEKEHPEIGENIQIAYDFKKDDVYFGYENLYLFIYRLDKTGKNFVRYFESIHDMEKYISKLTLVIDKDYAEKEINKLLSQVEKIKQEYNII